MPSSCSTIRNAVETSATFIRATRHQLLQQQEQGANTKSQSKGFPYRSPSLNFLAPEFLALEFFVNALDISKCRLDAVSGARHLACFLVNGAGCSFVHGVFTVSTCGMAAPIGSGLGPTQYKRGLGVRVCAGAYKSSPCQCGDQPAPPAGDRAVTPRLSEPPRMPKPARCGRRCLICNRRVLLRCGRCGRTTAGYDGLCAVSSCARHCTYAASPGFAPCDWHFASSSIALRCSISALVAQPLKATSSARTAGHRVRMSELKISCGFRRQISSVLSTDGRTGAQVGSAAWPGADRSAKFVSSHVFPAPIFGKIKAPVTVISTRYYWRPRQECQGHPASMT